MAAHRLRTRRTSKSAAGIQPREDEMSNQPSSATAKVVTSPASLRSRTSGPPTQHTSRTPILWAALGLFAFVLALYARLLFTNRVLASGDILHYFYPYRDYAAEALRTGRIPLWNPYMFLGAPFLANPQAAVLYPLHWPLSWLSVTKQIYWSAALHTWLLGFGGYLLMRRWQYQGLPAFATALVLAGSGFYGGLIGHINQMNGAAWLPWLVLIIEMVVQPPQSTERRPMRSRASLGIALFGGVTALMLLAGHTQTAYINLFAVGIWAVWPLASTATIRQPKQQLADTAPSLIVYFGGVLLGVLISMAQLLPTLELSELGLRSDGLSYGEASSFSLKPLHLLWTLLPSYGLADLSVVFDTLGYTEFVAYVGLIGLILAIIGAWLGRHTRDQAWVFGILFTLMGLFLAAGRWNPIYYLLYEFVPGLDLFRAPARWMMLYTMGMAVLAGIGFESLGVRIRDQRAKIGLPRTKVFVLRFLFFVLLVTDLLLAALALPHTHPTAPQSVYDVRTAPAHLLTDPAREVHPAAAGRFLSMSTLTFDPGDMADYERIFLQSFPPQLDEAAFSELIVALKSQEILAPNLPLLWRIPAVDGFDGGVLPLKRYIHFLTLLIDADDLVPDGRLREQVRQAPQSALLGMLNAQYLITDKLRDLWYDGVYYDRQMGARLDGEAQQQIDIDVPLPFEATHIDIIGHIDLNDYTNDDNEQPVLLGDAMLPIADVDVITDGKTETLTLTAGGLPGADLADGTLDSAMAETSGAVIAYRDVEGSVQEYRARLALSNTQAPERLTVRHSGAPADLVIQAMTLFDERTGMFSALLPSDRGDYELVHSGDVKIYENLDVQPRAYLTGAWTSVDGPDEALALLRNGALDARHHAVVENAPMVSGREGAPGEAVDEVGSAQIVAYSSEEITLQVDVQTADNEPALLVLSDAYYPGWQATIDGTEAPIYAANHLFRGLFVQPGEHTVVFSYRPQSWRQGVGISLFGLLILAVLLLRAWAGAFRQQSGLDV